jgi:hypothetical protein
MRVVYEAENLIDAHLIKGLLEHHGIPAWVRGNYLAGAVGELPVSGLLAVCVPEVAVPEANEALAQWRAQQAQPLADEEDAGVDPWRTQGVQPAV